MSWDCKYKVENNKCRRLKRECSPGDKGCILYGKFDFPFKVYPMENDNELDKDDQPKKK